MTPGLLFLLLAQGFTVALDAAVRPRRAGLRSVRGMVLHALAVTGLFGCFLAISGSMLVASVLTVALAALFGIVSNAKHAMLGEPLLFSDFALFASLVRHPGFYLTALSALQKVGLAIGALFLLLVLGALFVQMWMPHLIGAGLSLFAFGLLCILLRSKAYALLAHVPDAESDLSRHGLIATLLLYWLRWHETSDPPAYLSDGREEKPLGVDLPAPEVILVVQCESFADPIELTGEQESALPGLGRARNSAWQWGNLEVSGFGAYTMRTEFGVLFGRAEAALGFRRYDPFLTAQGEASHAISARLGASGYRCLFVHPHDLRFYARDKLMPAIGFDRMIGKDSFPAVVAGNGRYVDDRTVGGALCRLIDEAPEPTFIYTVTMENHGPWMKDRVTGSPGGLDAYLHHVRNSDAMLTDLIDHLAASKRPALLVFFGDHRPSIPGATQPGLVRHTPYVMLRFSEGKIIANADGRVDLAPDQLHHDILRTAGA